MLKRSAYFPLLCALLICTLFAYGAYTAVHQLGDFFRVYFGGSP